MAKLRGRLNAFTQAAIEPSSALAGRRVRARLRSMNKPVRHPDRHFIPPALAERFRPAVENGRFESVGEAVVVAAQAFADRLEFETADDVEAIRRSIAASIAEQDYEDADAVFARLRQRYGEGED